MNKNQSELTLKASIKQVMEALPLPIRQYLGRMGYSVVAENLMTKYGLRTEQKYILEREIILLLMGINNPDEFVQALTKEAKLDQNAVNGITHDVNQQIFVPLRDQMRGWASGFGQSKAPFAPVASQQRPSTLPSSYTPPRPPAFTSLLRASEMPQPTVIIPANPSMPTRPQQRDYITKVPKYTPPHPLASRPPIGVMPLRSTTPAQKPVDTDRMLEDHEEPRMEFKQSVSRISPPPNLPGITSLPIRSLSPEPPPPVPLTPRPPIQSYSSDPYREPVDDGGEGF
ncbi:hypothetical protein HKL94_00255 [Candidatus Parcubacteria bacterium]|nr:hypothetical protein [Candidatus Parcubacteria bacterium]